MGSSKIKKAIVREIQTKQFEQVTVTVDIEEEIEWKNMAERNKKTDKITNMLMEDFKKTYNEVVTTLGVDRCIGSVKVEKTSSDDEVDLFDE